MTSALSHARIPFLHTSATAVTGITGENRPLEDIDPDEVGAVVFVCGPIIRGHPVTDALIGRFPHARKIGVGVSILPPGNPLRDQPFDIVLAREGWTERHHDVAILAPAPHVDAKVDRSAPLRVGVALRGRQDEYGRDKCLSDVVSRLTEKLLTELRRLSDVEIVDIEHHLVRAARDPASIEALYVECDLVITSRFHGGVLALRNGIPFLAIDQIVGGAKVCNLLGGRGWPYVFAASDPWPEDLEQLARALISQNHAVALEAAAAELRGGAAETLRTMIDAVQASLR